MTLCEMVACDTVQKRQIVVRTSKLMLIMCWRLSQLGRFAMHPSHICSRTAAENAADLMEAYHYQDWLRGPIFTLDLRGWGTASVVGGQEP